MQLSIPIYPGITFGQLSQSAIDNSDGPVLSINQMHWFHKMHFSHRDDMNIHPLSSPFNDKSKLPHAVHTIGHFPKTHVIVAELDILHDEGLLYVDYLKQYPVIDVSVKCYNNTPHGFLGSSIFPHGREVLGDVTRLIRECLKK